MRRQILLGLTMCAAAVVACSDDPTAPPAPRVPVDTLIPAGVQAASTFPACTKSWKGPGGVPANLSGTWSTAANWRPSGVPGTADVACLNAIGTYTVTLATPVTVNAILIGGGKGVKATLLYKAFSSTALVAIGGLKVFSGSVLLTDASRSTLVISSGPVLIEGKLRAQNGSTDLAADSIVNSGTVEVPLGSGLEFDAPLARNSGTLAISGRLFMELDLGEQFRMESGALTGTGSFMLSGVVYGGASGLFSWTGGSMEAVRSDSVTPVMVGYNINLELGSTALSGALYLDRFLGGPVIDTVYGDIGSGVSLQLVGVPDVGYRLVNPLGGPTINSGTLIVQAEQPVSPTFSISGIGLVNRGTLRMIGETVAILLDSLVNEGQIELEGTHRVGGSASPLRNRGTVTVLAGGTLEMDSAAFIAEAGSTQMGALTLTNATLSGTGSVGDVTATGGSIAPGAPIGVLSFASLTLDSASSTVIDVAGNTTGAFDQLAIAGNVSYGGTLDLREVAPFLSGSCGQFLPIIADNSAGARGAFATVLGLAPGTGRGWRIHNPADTLYLVGHDPALAVSRGPSPIFLAEGAGATSYSVCLRSAPAANVTVTPTSTGGQLAALSPVVFTPTTWGVPLPISVTAVDDAIYEPPPQSATITHLVTSSDAGFNGAAPGNESVTILDNDGTTDLALTVLSAPPVATVGTQFTISLRNANLGPDVSSGSVFTVPASAGYTFVGSTGTFACTSTPVIGTSCNLASLVSGAQLDFTLTFQAVAAGAYPTTHTVTALQTDGNLTNNSKAQTITIN